MTTNDTLHLAGRNIVVTGGTSGIGAAFVKAFHRAGGHVYFCGRSRHLGESLAAALGPERISYTKADLTRETDLADWFGHIREKAARIDCLINNAAKDDRRTIEEMTVEEWDSYNALNMRPYFLACKLALPLLVSGSSIINLSSVVFHLGYKHLSAYASTKGAIIGFTRSLARELGPRGVRVNTLSPGWTMTEKQIRERVTPESEAMVREAQCLPDLLQPDEVADVALFLASPMSRAITGQNIYACHGWVHG
jgi:NAD(P)-dependent dehydrogenase (short-subunit alcohol dehydrogenase family)